MSDSSSRLIPPSPSGRSTGPLAGTANPLARLCTVLTGDKGHCFYAWALSNNLNQKPDSIVRLDEKNDQP